MKGRKKLIGMNGKKTMSPIEDAVRQVLEAHGKLQEFKKDGDFYLKAKAPGFMDLSIDKFSNGTVALAHYGEQNGDLMADPDILFSMELGWAPMEFTNNYAGIYNRMMWKENGKWMANIRQAQDCLEFCKIWASNILEQGFAKKRNQ